MIKNEGFVKHLIYALLSVGNILLLSNCTNPENYSNPKFQAVYEWIDQRDTSTLYNLLKNNDPEIRGLAAWGLGSIPDSAISPKIAQALQTEEDDAVVDALAFALGQTGSMESAKQVWAFHRQKKTTAFSQALCDAFGKCGLEVFFIEAMKNNALPNTYASGLFYLSRRGNLSNPNLLPALLNLSENEQQQGTYAAHALSRCNLELGSSRDALLSLIQKSNNPQKKIALSIALGKCSNVSSASLFSIFKEQKGNENQFVRLAVIRAARKAKLQVDTAWLKAIAIDASNYVRELGSDWLYESNASLQPNSIANWIEKETYSLVKYRLYAYLLRNELNTKISTEKLKQDFEKQADVYVKSYIIQALSEDFAAIQFLEELMYTTPDILIRMHAFDALIKIRMRSKFGEYRERWNLVSGQKLEAHFAQLFRDAIETHDVSMISLAAIALRDTSMPFADAPGKPVQFASIDFMRKALGTLQLPRDIEAFGELLHTISFYEGKAYEGSLKPDYNNAPNWAFAGKLKPDQQIEIVTETGQVIVELWPDVAPLTVAYMLKNIERGFYSNKRIHRLVPGFVIQDGCPRGDGYGGASETIRSEFSDRSFETGVLGMASAGPDTESTQWFIMQSDAPHLNGRYTAFGKVVSGLEHVLNMKHGGRIISMRVLP
jgi:cyclophilin family peptidyl-prolyl cis-trans isomerase